MNATPRDLINKSAVHFGDALLDDGFLPDYNARHFIGLSWLTEATRARYQRETDRAMPVVIALHALYLGTQTEADLLVLRDHMESQITKYLGDRDDEDEDDDCPTCLGTGIEFRSYSAGVKP